MLSVIMLSVIMLSVIMLSVIMLSVIMLSVIMLSVICRVSWRHLLEKADKILIYSQILIQGPML
jgi:hypothetical protein